VLSWGSFPSELSPLRFGVRSLALTHAGGSGPRSTCATGRPAVAVAFRDPDSNAWAREPRIRRYTVSREPRVPPSGSDPAHRRPREPSRAPVACSILTPCRACSERSVLPVPPLGGTPRLPALHHRLPRRGTGGWTSKTLSRRTVHPFRPLRGERATGSLAEPDLVPRHRVDLGPTDFRQPTLFATHSFARSRSVVGPPVARWASSPGLSSLVESGSEVRACERCRAYSRFGSRPFGPE